ncbi:WhiB family transcriptional regulator [Actinophytocola glycyrrhizae]|uniref:WhiB family transcriptional regulator n=1 Tax=Actinophytocola glycyrrhizae TaxID=2044873 RepID=A0ABV9RZS7_9PSEU
MDGRIPVDPEEYFTQVAADLDGLADVPDGALFEVVTRDGACMVLFRLELEPEWTGDDLTDRELAARVCADCPVRRECLELELRTSGDRTLGVWGALPADDVRALYPVWRSRRRWLGGQVGVEPGAEPGTGGGQR